ncbi:hypothetical protein NFI96_001009, partial [Prochilodus magdalenae]
MTKARNLRRTEQEEVQAASLRSIVTGRGIVSPTDSVYDGVNEKLPDSPGMGRSRSVNGGPGSPDLARHYKSSSPLPTVQLHPQSPQH